MIHTLTDETFDPTLRAAERPLLVEFGAPWCPPCRAMHPTLEAIAKARTDVTVVTVDVDESPDTGAAFGVRSLPTLLLFRDGRPVAQLVGAQSRARLDAWLDEHVSPAPTAPSTSPR